MDISEAYATLTSPSEPTRGASARMMHEDVERTRVAAVPPLPVRMVPAPAAAQAAAAAVQPVDKHKELRKLVIYALVVTLGLAFHFVCNDWLTRYLSKAYLSESSEQIAKLCYPACIVATIWIARNFKN